MFAVGDVPVLRVQKFQDIETVVTLGHIDFGGDMMAVWRANVMQMSRFCAQNLVFCPPSQQHLISLSKILYLYFNIQFKCTWKVSE